MGVVRIGIVGPSWWVNYWHLPAIQNHPDAEITAVCGSAVRDIGEVHEKYGAHAAYYTNFEEMMDSANLDGVIICTPNDTHHPAVMAALERGLHVTCEKPVAMNAEEAREMADTAKKKGLIGMSNFPYRANPAAVKMNQLIKEGFVGTPLHITGSYHGAFGLGNRPGWRGLREKSGSGILGDLGSHLIDLARFVTGDEFTSVSGHTMTALWDDGLNGTPELVRTEDPRVLPRNDDSCAFLSEFKSGMQGIFHTSWVAQQGELTQHQELEVYGTDGRLHFLATHGGTLLRSIKRGTARWQDIPVEGTVHPSFAEKEEEDFFRPGRLNETNNTYRWIEAIRSGQQTIVPDLEDGWRSQLVIDAVIQSSAERKWIDIQEDKVV